MFQFVIRRLLYSIVVLFAASVLVFTFVAKTGDPLAALTLNPRISQQSVQNIKDRKHLDESAPCALRLLGEGRGHETDSARRCWETSRSCPTSGGS